ncbi:MgtC/SapB family protein [Paenibacillus cremeus]|uniref:MgtC/SapB family protein n=1 Tax=Paenibacillus cremeus TaxID=2163881 RepID=A0A559KGR5_9BACL|nr:MgtC/SapB family protein [Paenibacillus cremeus]TVY11325.1 MgtC/SapB family protein [Paenibacillus cremeus]
MATVWDLSHLEVVGRVLLAGALAACVGFEREWRGQSAGFRTHILVSIGACLLMLLSIYGFAAFDMDPSNHPSDPSIEPNLLTDPARLAAQVINGIGFLGAGAIMAKGKGLATAASLWIVAGIGLGVGAGFYYGSILIAVLVLFIQIISDRFEKTERH